MWSLQLRPQTWEPRKTPRDSRAAQTRPLYTSRDKTRQLFFAKQPFDDSFRFFEIVSKPARISIKQGRKGESRRGNLRSASRKDGETEMTEKVADRLSKCSGASGAAARLPACVMSVTLAIARVAAVSAPPAASAQETQPHLSKS